MPSHDEDLNYHATHIRKVYRTEEKGEGQVMDVIACLGELHHNGSSGNSPAHTYHALGRMKPHRRQIFLSLDSLSA